MKRIFNQLFSYLILTAEWVYDPLCIDFWLIIEIGVYHCKISNAIRRTLLLVLHIISVGIMSNDAVHVITIRNFNDSCSASDFIISIPHFHFALFTPWCLNTGLICATNSSSSIQTKKRGKKVFVHISSHFVLNKLIFQLPLFGWQC